MSTETFEPPFKDDFKLGIWVSLFAHFSLAVFFIVRSIVFTGDPYQDIPAIRVDIVGLPDKVQQLPPTPAEPKAPEAKAPTPAPAPKAEPAAPEPAKAKPLPKKPDTDAINLDKTKTKQSDALKKLKSLDALDRIKKDVSKEASEAERKRLESLAADAKAKAGEMKVKGNVIAAGSSLTGIDKLEHEEYRGRLDRHIKPFWQLPEWLARKGLRALVLVRVDAQGRPISKQVTKSSGNQDFDASVLETIDRAAPFPAPPEKFVAKVGGDGILLEFGEEGGN